MSGLAILCSGQGRQDRTSFEALLKYPEAKAMFEHLLHSDLIPETLRKYFISPSGNSQIILNNEFAQPFIVIYHIMLWEVIKKNLPAPEIFAGYSLGELSMYGLAEVIKPKDLLHLSVLRGRLTSQAAITPQSMVAVIGIAHARMEKICVDCNVHIAIINGGNHFVAGLSADKVSMFIDECKKSGAGKTVHLPVSIASHTPYMENAAVEFSREVQKICFTDSASGIIAGVSGEKLFSKEDMLTALTAQISHTIDWRACMESAVSYGCRVFLETGPGNALSKMLVDSFPDVMARSVSDFHDLHAIGPWMKSALARQY